MAEINAVVYGRNKKRNRNEIEGLGDEDEYEQRKQERLLDRQKEY